MSEVRTEGTFETVIESHLLANGYVSGSKSDYDPSLALDTTQLFDFLEGTQPEAWAKYSSQWGADAHSKFADRLTSELKSRGSLDVWRRGVKDSGVSFRLAYFKPATTAGPELLARYDSNRVSVVRQLKYGASSNTVDLAVFLNGIPLATIELKNHASGQSVSDAISQYLTDRHPAEPIFRYTERALVHFAVDDAEVYMTTRLSGKDTVFLPFNRGVGDAAGNPPNPNGYRTAYLWEEVLERESLLDIVGRFLTVAGGTAASGSPKDGTVVFPRFHQLDVVRRLEWDARSEGPGRNYLVMHSTGSGKSLSIAWTAHRLYSLHDEKDERVFHSVIVVTDRVVLNKQLQDTIYGIDHTHGVVEAITGGSTQLADALESGTPIVVVTLQTFPFVLEKVATLPERRYAVIADEAHSSQTGIAAAKLKEVLGAAAVDETVDENDDDLDLEDALLAAARARGPQSNLSYLAFTATPKAKTLQMFGTEQADGTYRPFHVYSMRQAIQEGFIMDVLTNYTTYQRYYELGTAVEELDDDPELDKGKAAKAVAKFIELHPHNLSQKATVILDHFDAVTAAKIGGRAKAMVVCGSRLAAMKMFFALREVIGDRSDLADPGVLVAFSGTLTDPDTGLDHTETGINGFGESELPTRFATDDYRILVVAEKYQTGFDQPLLHTMFVDKKLAGVHAVQTLSRLNRRAPAKEDTFVLDFVNEADGIADAYRPYYQTAVLSEGTDPNILYDLADALQDFGFSRPGEVDTFAETFMTADDPKKVAPKLNAAVDPAVDRFRNADDEAQDTFRTTLGQYVRLYGFLSNVVTWQDSDLEKMFQYGRWLLRKLPSDAHGPPLELDDQIALTSYRLAQVSDGSISLGDPGELPPIAPAGSRISPDQFIRLSELIAAINEKFAMNLKPEHALVVKDIITETIADEDLQPKAKANSQEVFADIYATEFLKKILDRREIDDEFLKLYLDNDEFKTEIQKHITPWVYQELKKRASTEELIAGEETDRVEFKSTAFWNIKAEMKTDNIGDAVVKTIAAFLNSKGGTLLIGVDDDGNTGLLAHDLEKVYGGSLDKWQNALVSNLLSNAIGKPALAFVNVTIADVNGDPVARLDVERSSGPVWAKTSKGSGVFYVRIGNTTHELEGQDEWQYIQDHWKTSA